MNTGKSKGSLAQTVVALAVQVRDLEVAGV
jgi:hypothetical protein